ncbi:MAG: hypothetical protein JWL84_4501 [Rhodospirillales bacterium]|nr:hypothetical protein [Rhodospirillales bacterium]
MTHVQRLGPALADGAIVSACVAAQILDADEYRIEAWRLRHLAQRAADSLPPAPGWLRALRVDLLAKVGRDPAGPKHHILDVATG